MAEALAGVQIAASIIQVIDVGVRVLERLKDFHDTTNALPDALKHISNKLPILIDALRLTNDAMEVMTDRARKAFQPAIQECYTQITRLEVTINAVLPRKGDTGGRRTWKAILSVKQDGQVKKMDKVIQEYMAVMSQHHTSSLAMMTLNGKFTDDTNSPRYQES